MLNTQKLHTTNTGNPSRASLTRLILLAAVAVLFAAPIWAQVDTAEVSSVEPHDAGSSVPEKSIVCHSGTSCTGDYPELFSQIYVGHYGVFWVQPTSALLDAMTALGLESTCVLKNDSWFQVMSEDGDGGETALKNAFRIADLTNPRVPFYVAAVSPSDNTCRITGFHSYGLG